MKFANNQIMIPPPPEDGWVKKLFKYIRDRLTKHFPNLSIQTVSAALGGLIAMLMGTYILNKCSYPSTDQSVLDKHKSSQSFPLQNQPIRKPISSPIKKFDIDTIKHPVVHDDIRPSKSYVVNQIKKRTDYVRLLVKASDFKYINGYAVEKNKYIAVVSYNFCFKISYKEAKRQNGNGDFVIKRDQLPKEKQKSLKEYEIEELNRELLEALYDKYGEWKTNERFTITGKFVLLKTENGWIFDENETEIEILPENRTAS
jgi:hypothetical protein